MRAATHEPRLEKRRTRHLVEWGLVVVVALGVAVGLRTYIVQSFFIPSTSMAPTLRVGDRVLVNKLAYRLGDPGRGDIVVFRAPPGEGIEGVNDLIKRVVGLPGETIEGRDGRIYIDGAVLEEPWLPEGVRSREFGARVVAEDSYFVMGDNRLDSRDSTSFDAIPRDTIVGRAFIRIWPLSDFGGI